MKIIKLMGGLGNQMFEYAFGLALSEKTSEEVLYDLSWFEEFKSYEGPVAYRIYALDNFNIEPKFASYEQVKKCINEHEIKVTGFTGTLKKLLNKKTSKIIDDIIREKETNIYEPELFDLQGNLYYDGFFQCEKYFKDYRDDILKSFSLTKPLDDKNKEILEKIKSTNAVSLHVRRGDYVNLQQTHGLCSLEYYQKAMNYIAQKTENPHFYLFSDDISWVVENLKLDFPHTVIDFNNANTNYFDLELMKSCKHNIIANSSFSWWGAWLNENPEKIVVAPEKWFTNKHMKSKDIIPESWVKF